MCSIGSYSAGVLTQKRRGKRSTDWKKSRQVRKKTEKQPPPRDARVLTNGDEAQGSPPARMSLRSRAAIALHPCNESVLERPGYQSTQEKMPAKKASRADDM